MLEIEKAIFGSMSAALWVWVMPSMSKQFFVRNYDTKEWHAMHWVTQKAPLEHYIVLQNLTLLRAPCKAPEWYAVTYSVSTWKSGTPYTSERLFIDTKHFWCVFLRCVRWKEQLSFVCVSELSLDFKEWHANLFEWKKRRNIFRRFLSHGKPSVDIAKLGNATSSFGCLARRQI